MIALTCLFIGMAGRGIAARVNLLTVRGGGLDIELARQANGLVIFEFATSALGLAALICGFLLFDWWVPPLSFVLGYWVLAPIFVNRTTHGLFWRAQSFLTLVSLTCFIVVCYTYLISI